MRKFTLFLFLSLVMLFTSLNLSAQYLVSGADEPGVDGYYYEDGTEDGKPLYTNGHYFLHYKGCTTKWAISSLSACPLYSTTVDGDVPPAEGWHEGGRGDYGKAPLIAKMNSIAWDTKIIIESPDDDGTFNDSIQMLLYTVDNPFTGNNGDDFVADGKVIVTNLPAGLTAIVERTGDSTLVLKLAGSAINHTYQNNVDNISLQFQNSAFSDGNASEIENSVIENIGIRFLEQFLVFGATITPEVNDTFSLSGIHNMKPLYTSDTYYMFYKGCQWGTKWAISNDIGNCPEYTTKNSGDFPNVTGWSDGRAYGNDTIYMAHLNSIHYNKTSIFESGADDGTFTDSIIVRFVAPADGNTFTGTNNDDFIAGGKLVVSNLPAGLTAVATRTSETSLTVKFTGSATNHTPDYNVNNLTFEFQNSAFSNNDASSVENDNNISMEFIEKVVVVDAVSYPDMNGIYISSGFINNKHSYSKGDYTIGYKGCNAKWVLVEGTNIFNCPEYSTLYNGDTPEGVWGQGGRGGSQEEKVYVIKPNSLLYSNDAFIEDSINNGSTSDSIVIRFIYPDNADGFTGSNGDDFVASGKVLITNLPEGLTAVATRTSDTTIVVKLTGTATHHTINYNADNIGIAFQNTAFLNGNASSVNYSTKNNIKMRFIQKYEVMNAEDTPDVNGTYISSGIVNEHVVYAKGEYRLGYRGCEWGAYWVIVDGDNDGNVSPGYCPIYNVEEFSEDIPVTGWENSSMMVYPHNSLLYLKDYFNESESNDGSIDNSDTLVIRYFYPESGAKFSGVNGDDFVTDEKVTIQNLPAGLTVVMTRTSDTTLAVVLNGSATMTDVNNLTFIFSDNAFEGMDASDVFFSTKEDLEIDFHDEYYVASTGGDYATIAEAVADSKVKNGDVLILAAETFTEYGVNVTKGLTFRGQGAGKTIVQAHATPGSATDRIFYMSFNYDNYRTVAFENMTIRNGKDGNSGGGIFAEYANIHIKNCEFENNQATYNGGAIYTYFGNFTAENSTFSNNSTSYSDANSGGGALYILSYRDGDTASISNCTFSNNSTLGAGGAVRTYHSLNIINSTISNNTATYYGGGIFKNGNTIDMFNVIVANNTSSSGNDIYGSVTANYCLIENITGVTITGSNNVTGSDPELSALAHNGGSTQTCAISSTSLAKDAGTNEGAPELDQRGVAMFNGIKDIGAYEYNTEPLILVSDTILNFGNTVVNDSSELCYSLSAINLTNDLVITSPAGYKLSGYSGESFVGTTSITLSPVGGIISDTVIYVHSYPTTVGALEGVITLVSTDAETINITLTTNGVTAPTGANKSVKVIKNVKKYFTNEDFTFADTDGGIFAGIQILTKETNGDLEYDGVNVAEGVVSDDVTKLSFMPFENECGLAYATFTFKVKDNTGLYSEETYTMAIDVNDIPAGANDAVTTSEDVNKTFAAGDFTFTNTVGSFDGINIVSAETSGDLEYNGADVTASQECADVSLLVFKPVANENGSSYATFEFKVKDDLGEISAESYTMTIDVTAVNDAPTLANAIPDGDATAGVAYTYVVPENTFADIDDGDVLTYTATLSDNSSLPAWLTFTAATRTFSGTPTSSGNITIKVTATDVALANVSDEYVLTIASGTGIDDLFGTNLQVYPNPTSGLISISLKNNVSEVRVEITDVIGKAVIIKTLSDSKTDIDLSGYAKGVYFIKLSNGEETVTRKIVVQ